MFIGIASADFNLYVAGFASKYQFDSGRAGRQRQRFAAQIAAQQLELGGERLSQ